jgi:hypothetical protein
MADDFGPGEFPEGAMPFLILKRIFPEDFGERRIISEGYLDSCPIV